MKAAKKQSQEEADKSPYPNIFRALIESDLPPEEKEDTRLQDEAQIVVGAGVTTTGWALSVATFHIVKNPSVFKKLRSELEEAIPDPSAPLEWSKLEQLPLLTGCLKEGIRLSYGISGRSPRLAPNPIQYKQWTIPARTAVSMTLVDINDDEKIFPDAHTFKPERWIGQPRTLDGDLLDKYFVGFMKGNRSCLGMK